jgi:hypothetical protein
MNEKFEDKGVIKTLIQKLLRENVAIINEFENKVIGSKDKFEK